MQQKQEYNALFKLLILGDQYVGKTTLVQKFVGDIDPDVYYETLGVEQKLKTLHLVNQQINLNIWDTAGNARFWHIVQRYLRDIDGALVCFDLTNSTSFQHVKTYVERLRTAQPHIPVILVGCKSDLTSKRLITMEHAHSLAQKLGTLYIETSATKEIHGDEPFMKIAQCMYFQMRLNTIRPFLELHFEQYLNRSTQPALASLVHLNSSKKEQQSKDEYTLIFQQLVQATNREQINYFFKKTLNQAQKTDQMFIREHPILSSFIMSPSSSALRKIAHELDKLLHDLYVAFDLEQSPSLELNVQN